MTPAFSPGDIVETLRGVRLQIVRVDRQPHVTLYHLRGVEQPYRESQLRPVLEPKEIVPPSRKEYGRLVKGKS